MFCRNCGTQMDEGVKFCPNCGTPTEGPMGNAGQGTAPAAPPTGKKKPPYVAIGAIVVAVVLVIAIIFGMRSCVSNVAGGLGKSTGEAKSNGEDSYTQVVETYMEAIEECDGEKYLSLSPEEMIEFQEKEEGLDREEQEEEMTVKMEVDRIDLYGEADVKYVYKIVDEKSWSEEEIKDAQNDLEASGIDMEIQAGKDVNVQTTVMVDGEEDEEHSGTQRLMLIKVDGKWYYGGRGAAFD